ncbi:hypothetical protein ACFXJ8_31715 [Nonomuraea sp. NPDC059194]|uniref:hypothetical protein n=1 Tax=Nonomuraea sp. NPDC059194 TaxID=3346764 RepID=UPI0036CF622F
MISAVHRACATREDEWLRDVLITTWALTTGRLPPRDPPEALSIEELIEFWADDRLAVQP